MWHGLLQHTGLCMQDENAHLNAGSGSDDESEVAETGPDDDGDVPELEDDEDEEVDDAYMQQLAREARKLKVLSLLT